MKKFVIVVKKARLACMKDDTEKLTMTDRAYVKAEESRVAAEGRCSTRYFGSVENVIERVAKLIYNAPKKGCWLAKIHESNSEYAKSCKFDMKCTYAEVLIKDRKIESITFERTYTGGESLWTNSEATAIEHIENRLKVEFYGEMAEAIKKMAEARKNHFLVAPNFYFWR